MPDAELDLNYVDATHVSFFYVQACQTLIASVAGNVASVEPHTCAMDIDSTRHDTFVATITGGTLTLTGNQLVVHMTQNDAYSSGATCAMTLAGTLTSTP